MKPKTIFAAALLILAAASLVYLAASVALRPADPSGGAAGDDPPAEGAPAEITDGVIVTYFLTDIRCSTCHKIEAYTREAVETGFADALRDGRLMWRTVNTDREANKHFIDDYGLIAKAVVLARRRGGREVDWKNLDRIWDLVGDKDAYVAYIRDEVAAFAKG
ncbi:MAG: hypothetical protein IMZ66_11030 [Planctomycetes bacterium]|nr:hypothetical protein [Planctomycetota bacterium]